MSKIIDKLIDNILEFVLEDARCHHEEDHDEDGRHTSVEYSLNNETKLRERIGKLLKPKVTEEWIEEKAGEVYFRKDYYTQEQLKDFIRSLVEAIQGEK